MTFEPGDLVLVDTRALRGAQDADQTRKFAARWVGPFAVRARVNGLAYTLELPPEWRCHKTIDIGSLKNLGSQLDFRGRCREERLPAGKQRAPRMPRRFCKPGLQRVEGGLGKNS